jgi:hypothetical protein
MWYPPAVEALESTCIAVWISRSHGSCCRQGGIKPLGSRSSGACFPGVGSRRAVQWGEPSFRVAGALGPTSWHRLPGAMVAAACLGEPSLQAVGVLGPDCQPGLPGAQSTASAASLGEPSLLACEFCYLWSSRAVDPSYTGVLISLAFQGEGSRLCSGGSVESSCVCWKAGLTTANHTEKWSLESHRNFRARDREC